MMAMVHQAERDVLRFVEKHLGFCPSHGIYHKTTSVITLNLELQAKKVFIKFEGLDTGYFSFTHDHLLKSRGWIRPIKSLNRRYYVLLAEAE